MKHRNANAFAQLELMNVRIAFHKIAPILSWIALLAAFCPAATQAQGPQPAATAECVILLHGLGRTADSMKKMARTLENAGFDTVNLDYPSRTFSIERLAMDTIPDGIRHCQAQGAQTIHFVTHSMGGILLRYYLTRRPIENFGRAVMLSPPNQGSEIVDILGDYELYQWYHGPAGLQLGTGPDSFVAGLGPVDYPVGVITGNKHALFDAWFAGKIPGDDDGKVSVERAKVEGMADFLELPFSHPFIMDKPAVAEQTIHFLRHGLFRRPTGAHSGNPTAASGQR